MEYSRRDYSLDIAKGIGIIAVLIGHLSSIGRVWIFSFHMPLFFILAGYFFKPENLKNRIRKDSVRLLVPYLLTSIAIILFYFLLSFISKKDINVNKWIIAAAWGSGGLHSSLYLGSIPYIGAIWFLLALFWCKFSFTVLFSFCKNIYALGILCMGISILSIYINNNYINLPFSLLPGLAALIFYYFGYLCNKWGGVIDKYAWIIGLPLILIWVVNTIFQDSCLALVNCSYQFYPLSIIGGLGGTLFICILARVIYAYTRILSRFLIWIGEASLLILCIHLIDLDLPIRDILSRVFGFNQLVFDFILCICGTILLSQISVIRNVFKIKKVTFRNLYIFESWKSNFQ